jgi:hypothetical protein
VPIQRNIVIDNNPPIVQPVTFTEITNPQYQHAIGTNLWFNPAQTGAVQVNVDATDGGSGMQNVTFPDLDGAPNNWTPPGAVDPTGNPYTLTYNWLAGSASSGVVNAVALDNSGNAANAPFQVTADSTIPAGGTLSYPNAFQNSTTATLTFTYATDAQSGIASHQLQRRQAPLSAGACGVFGAWSDLGAPNPSSPFNNTLLSNATCYEYQLVATDNVGNQSQIVFAGQTKVDTAAPGGTIDPNPV